MSTEEQEKQNLINTPPLAIPRLQFLYAQPLHQRKEETKAKLIDLVKQHSMLVDWIINN
jgi:hypothetical protein